MTHEQAVGMAALEINHLRQTQTLLDSLLRLGVDLRDPPRGHLAPIIGRLDVLIDDLEAWVQEAKDGLPAGLHA